MNTTWSVKIERLPTQLRVGVDPDEIVPQPVWVTLQLRGVAAACPNVLSECIDYAPLCRWITEQWPRTAHVPLLETRVNELVAVAFDLDARVQEVHVGLAKQRMSGSASIGIERCVSRPEFDAQRRHLRVTGASRASSERTRDEHLPA